MPQSRCIRCRTELPSSELIRGYCVPCKMKGFETARKMFPIIEIFASIYKFAPILAGFIALLYLIFNLASTLALTILIAVVLVMLVISVLGMVPHLLPDFSFSQLQDQEAKLKSYFENYVPSAGRSCVNHPARQAVGRCDHCYDPFCVEEFIFVFAKPAYCRKCAPLIPVGLNFWAALNGLLAVGVLAFAGILTIGQNFDDFSTVSAFGLLLGFLIPFGILLGFFWVYSWLNRQVKAQLQTPPRRV